MKGSALRKMVTSCSTCSGEVGGMRRLPPRFSLGLSLRGLPISQLQIAHGRGPVLVGYSQPTQVRTFALVAHTLDGSIRHSCRICRVQRSAPTHGRAVNREPRLTGDEP